MMQTETKTRTQRRLEKRQTIIILALLLLVALLSFVLGVTTGRRGAERGFAQQVKDQQEEVRIVQVPAAPPVPAATAPRVDPPGGEKGALVDTVVENARLSFYDDLVRDSSPLGSGINQPPPEEARSPAITPPLELADQPIVARGSVTQALAQAVPVQSAQQQVSKAAAPASADPILPPVAAQGSHVVQVGSFGSAADAASLRQRLLDKGYPVFLAEADLGERGIWYRVRIGPFADSATAGDARQVILDKEQIEGLVTRHTR
ncbi:SPOR domain-containing protein [Pelovirga terrestris]|uniref:SPOR domain-containing protein n=1 Tax=Pelovirga terrestris TaxID=2771352 RepID=A0A8J6QWJ8_9BACT|nr:SPOR domain-containing protein [Pelovirga terrestris]MBD1399783.1 SPOR domain-containing protein [Pelovirga terrestris]